MIHVFESENFSTVYKQILEKLYSEPEYVTKPRDLKIHELINPSIIIHNPNSCLYQNQVRSSKYNYIANELLYYFSGRNDVDWIGDCAAFWHKIANSDGTINSAYGHLIFQDKNEHSYTPYQWAIQSLKEDKDSRQAILHFNKTTHQYDGNRDQVCTMYAIFHIRNNQLHLTVDMRSNDVITGLPTDIAFFVTLQKQMLLHLKSIYPNLTLGSYMHEPKSLHLYESNFNTVGNMLEHQFTPEYLPPLITNLIDIAGNPTFNINDNSNRVEELEFTGRLHDAIDKGFVDMTEVESRNILWNWIVKYSTK